MLSLTDSGEIRLEISLANGKKKTFVQTKVPVLHSIRYSEEEGALFNRISKEGGSVTALDVQKFNYDFLANVFEDEDVTYDLLIKELDCNEEDLVKKIIRERVLNQKPEIETKGAKEEKKH